MNSNQTSLLTAPIIEAVLDIDCDLPPLLNWASLQATAKEMLQESYPTCRQQFIQEHSFTKEVDAAPEFRMSENLGAVQFLTLDEKQLIQFRPGGFSFNRLAPYTSMDDYMPEIQTAWYVFRKLVKPLLIRKIGIRMINRILLPMPVGQMNFGDFLKVPPRLPETGSNLMFLGLLEHHMAIDQQTGNHANIVKTTESSEDGKLPLILDIDVFFPCQMDPENWDSVLERIESLRNLKNQIFKQTLTQQCLNLFLA